MNNFENSEINELLDFIDRTNESIISINSKLNTLKAAKDIMDAVNFSTSGIATLIDGFLNQIKVLEMELSKRTQQIDEIQKKCNHKFECVGHDSHHEYYRCSICGVETRV